MYLKVTVVFRVDTELFPWHLYTPLALGCISTMMYASSRSVKLFGGSIVLVVLEGPVQVSIGGS